MIYYFSTVWIDKLDFFKIEYFCSSKDIINKRNE